MKLLFIDIWNHWLHCKIEDAMTVSLDCICDLSRWSVIMQMLLFKSISGAFLWYLLILTEWLQSAECRFVRPNLLQFFLFPLTNSFVWDVKSSPSQLSLSVEISCKAMPPCTQFHFSNVYSSLKEAFARMDNFDWHVIVVAKEVSIFLQWLKLSKPYLLTLFIFCARLHLFL